MGAFAEYESYDAVGLAELVAKGEVSAEDLLDSAIARVEEHNPTLNAVVIPLYGEARAALRAGLPSVLREARFADPFIRTRGSLRWLFTP